METLENANEHMNVSLSKIKQSIESAKRNFKIRDGHSIERIRKNIKFAYFSCF
jgi:hypothetical protein